MRRESIGKKLERMEERDGRVEEMIEKVKEKEKQKKEGVVRRRSRGT